MKVGNSFLLIDPWWFYCKAVNLSTGDPQPTDSLCWHLQQWLECHCFPILHCHSGSTRNAFYLILQWNTHTPARTHTHWLFHLSSIGLWNWICFEHPPQYCLDFLHSVTLVSHTNGNKAKLLTLHIIVDPKGKMSVSMENSENKEIVTICAHAGTNVHPCQFSQVFEHEIAQFQLTSLHLLEISTQNFNRSWDQCA